MAGSPSLTDRRLHAGMRKTDILADVGDTARLTPLLAQAGIVVGHLSRAGLAPATAPIASGLQRLRARTGNRAVIASIDSSGALTCAAPVRLA